MSCHWTQGRPPGPKVVTFGWEMVGKTQDPPVWKLYEL